MRESELVFGFAGILICCTIWAVVKIGAWLLVNYPKRDLAIDLLDCGCPRGGVVYGCMHCGDERCEVHRQALCCEKRIDNATARLNDELLADEPFGGWHEADVDLSEENEAYAVDFLAWESQFQERAR